MTSMTLQTTALDGISTSNGTTAIDELTTIITNSIGVSSSLPTVIPTNSSIGISSSLTTVTTTNTSIGMPSSLATVTPNVTHNPANKLDQDAIIGGVIIGLLLIAIALAAVCLARARRQRTRQSTSSKAGPSTVREPNPYTNPCFDGINGEMGERQCHHTEEPAKSTTESMNTVRNKEDHWIIPVEELQEDDLASNYDTTKF